MKLSHLYIISGIFFFSFLWGSTYAQNFPVQANLQLIPPHTPFLSDYAVAFPNKVNIQLLLKDANEVSYQAKLRFRIEGQGYSIRTKTDFLPAPIILDFGVPLTLTGADLAAYFDPVNLDIEGIPENEFISSGGKLPEGVYTFCIEVYDYIRDEGSPVSNQACFTAIFKDLDPPIVVQPIGELLIQEPQQYVFVWQPQHIPTGPTDYTLRLFEYDQNLGLTVDQIMQTFPPYFEVTTSATVYNYTPADPLLELGQTYIVSVQATDPMGACVFKNNGFSPPEVCYLTNGNQTLTTPCDPPIVSPVALPPEGQDEQMGNIPHFIARWEPVDDNRVTGYEIEVAYDPDFSELLPYYDPNVFEEPTASELIVIDENNNLNNTTYYYRIRALGPGAECQSEWSNAIEASFSDCENAVPIDSLYLPILSIDSAVISWRAVPGATEYYYELAESADFTFGLLELGTISDTSITHYGLTKDTLYHIRVLPLFDGCEVPFDTLTYKIKARNCNFPEVTYDCGNPLSIEELSQVPIEDLEPGDTVMAGDYFIILTEVEKNGDTYTGTGFMEMGLFSHIEGGAEGSVSVNPKLNVSFEDIRVNEDCRLLDGMFDVGGAGFTTFTDVFGEEFGEGLDDLLDVLDDIDDVIDNIDDIIQTVDSLITEIEPYLPDSILTNLEDAKDNLQDAQEVYDSIQTYCDTVQPPELCDSTALQNAQDSLEQAIDDLEDAIDDYKDAIKDFGEDFVNLVAQTIEGILEDCANLNYEERFTEAVDSASQQVLAMNGFTITNEGAVNGAVSLSGTLSAGSLGGVSQELTTEVDPITAALIDTACDERALLFNCKLFGELLLAIGGAAATDMNAIEDIKDLFAEAGVDLLPLIGEKVKAVNEGEMTEEEAIEALKIDLQEALQGIIDELNSQNDFYDLIQNFFGGSG